MLHISSRIRGFLTYVDVDLANKSKILASFLKARCYLWIRDQAVYVHYFFKST